MQLGDISGIFRRSALLALAIGMGLSASRLFLTWFYADRVAATDGLTFILLTGLRFDLIFFGMMFGLVLVTKPGFHASAVLRRIGKWLLPVYLGIATGLVFFVEAATLPFMEEFGVRPNILFVEYLSHPREVFLTLISTQLLPLVTITLVAVSLMWFVTRWLRRDPGWNVALPFRTFLIWAPVAAVAVFLMIRSTLDHRPANPSIAAFSQDAMVNTLPMSSPYSLIYAIYEQVRDSIDKRVRYTALSDEEVIALVIEEAGIDPLPEYASIAPSMHRQQATQRHEPPLNLVIVLQESLGAEFIGSLGGSGVTPVIDSLADESIWFERLYATGTRSVRGLEAILTGFTPTPRRAVVKLGETQLNFFTLANLLQARGYHTSFVYGGESHFDNMRRFFRHNGFSVVIDEKDYENPEFHGSWGVSDEDLFKRAHELFIAREGQPFFSLVFTSSNHSPFDIPAGRVTPEPGPKGPQLTAVKYADYALGQFLDRARSSPYWQNTVFLVTSDHNSRVKGTTLVPVQRFHIPGAILGAGIEPRRIPGISSQIDLLPTLLSLIGVSAIHPAIGRDLTRPENIQGAGRAIMQFRQIQGYLEGDRMIVLQPHLDPLQVLVDALGQLTPMNEVDPDLRRRALAHAHWGALMIRRKAYFNPEFPPPGE